MEVNIDLMTQLETLTKQGDTQQVSEIINRLVLKRIPRELAAQLAQICFRNSLYIQSLRILNPIVCPPTPISPKPQPTEIIAYATALVSLNMNREARNLLQQLDTTINPEALLIESFSYFGEWSYEKTIPLLKRFSTNPRVSLYRQIVGKVNLAAAYVTSAQQIEAENLLLELLKVTSERNFRLLQGNTLELLAQLEIQKKNYSKALEYLNEAKQIFPDSTSIYFFFVKKWECICRLLLSPHSKELIKSCESLKSEALKWRHWETARDIDLYIAFATNNMDLIQKLVQGTPNSNYIKKIELLFGYKITPEKIFKLRSDNDITPPKVSFDFIKISERIQTNKYQNKLFTLLTKDFYRPVNLGYLFSQLHPEENFNPLTSEKRILNQIYTLAQNLNTDNTYFELHKSKMDFIFKLKPGVELVFKRQGNRRHHATTLKEKMRSFGAVPFSTNQLAQLLNCSKRKAQQVIKQLKTQNFVECINKGPKTVYVLSNFYKISF